MILYKSKDEILKMRESGKIVASVLNYLSENTKSGMSTWDLEELANEFLYSNFKNVRPAFKGYMGYPTSLCVSINDEVVHGIPSKKKIISDGDIVSIDFGVENNGYYGDSAITIMVGDVDSRVRKLVEVTKASLMEGIKNAKVGNHLYDVSASVQEYVEEYGFSVVRDFVGHGIGRSMHESPQVPNFGEHGTGIEIKDGLTIAIEPMVNIGKYDVKVLDDGWTAVTKDGSFSAHFEHTIAITNEGTYILTEL